MRVRSDVLTRLQMRLTFFFDTRNRIFAFSLDRHATLACYKALVKKNPKVSRSALRPSWTAGAEHFVQAGPPLGSDRVNVAPGSLPWCCLTLDVTKPGQNCAEGVLRGRDYGIRGYCEEPKSVRAFDSGCVSCDAIFRLRRALHTVCIRGRTQVEAGSRTVLGIGPGKSSVLSDEVRSVILLISPQHQ